MSVQPDKSQVSPQTEVADELKKAILEVHAQDDVLSSQEDEIYRKVLEMQKMLDETMASQVHTEHEWLERKHETAGLQSLLGVSNRYRAANVSKLATGQDIDSNLTDEICETPNIESQKCPVDDVSMILFDPLKRKEYIQKEKSELLDEIADIASKIEESERSTANFEQKDENLRKEFNLALAAQLDIEKELDCAENFKTLCKAVGEQIAKLKSAQN